MILNTFEFYFLIRIIGKLYIGIRILFYIEHIILKII